MTYEQLFHLKFNESVPTYKLGKRFPKERRKISKIALLQLSPAMLKKVVKKRSDVKKLMLLKAWLIQKTAERKKRKV